MEELESPPFKNMLIMFGGLQGLEAALESDESLAVDEPQLLFDHYINVLPNQGSRTIRTEEAILISLAAFHGKLKCQNAPKPFDDVSKIATSSEGSKSITVQKNKTAENDLSRFD